MEDRRGSPPAAVAGGVGVAGLLLAVVVALLGGDPTVVLQQMGGGVPAAAGVQATRQRASPQEDQLADFVSVVLADTEDTSSQQFHSFTHGTAAQRQRRFATGSSSGDMNSCDTFRTRQL